MGDVLTLLDQAKLLQGSDPLSAAIIEIFPEHSAVLRRLPFETIAGAGISRNRENKLGSVGFRAINDVLPKGQGRFEPYNESLFAFGFESFVDEFIIKTEGGNIADTRAKHDRLSVKASSLKFEKSYFDSDYESGGIEFNGLNKRLAGGSQEVEAGTNGAVLTKAMVDDMLDLIIGEASAILCSKRMVREITKIADNVVTIARDDFGKMQTFYAGIPIDVVEEDNDGNIILDFDETVGSSDVTASIYAVKFGEGFHTGLQSGPISVRDLGESAAGATPGYTTRGDWNIGLALHHPKAVARLTGVLKS